MKEENVVGMYQKIDTKKYGFNESNNYNDKYSVEIIPE